MILYIFALIPLLGANILQPKTTSTPGLVSDLERLTQTLQQISSQHQDQQMQPPQAPNVQATTSEMPHIKILTPTPPPPPPPPPSPPPFPIIVQAVPSTYQQPASPPATPVPAPPPAPQPDIAALLTRVVGELQSKLAAVRQEAERLEQKKTQLETQQKELNLKLASENVRHRDELRGLHQAHVQIQAELLKAKQEREHLERERLDKLLQRN